MVDVFVMLLQPGSGDDLQGIKRGILELVDLVVVTKDDGDSREMIKKAKHDYTQALQILRHDDGIPEVFSCSSVTKAGFKEILAFLENYFKSGSQKIKSKREKQGIDWMWQLIHEALLSDFHASVSKEKINEVRMKLLSAKLTPPQAAEELVSSLRSHLPK
jgi:LAO/AO transport system kinase